MAMTAAVASGRFRSSRKSVVTKSAPIRCATSVPRSARVSAIPIHWTPSLWPRRFGVASLVKGQVRGRDTRQVGGGRAQAD